MTDVIFQLCHHIGDEIVEPPADAVGQLHHVCQTLAELGVQFPPFALQEVSQFTQNRLDAIVEALVNVPILVREFRAVLNIRHQQFGRPGEVAGSSL